ncbi:MAG TPA: YceI family protein [Planctomycetota bacterium]|nr:YceI family protein [Planctomycetota bacterium]
MSHAPILAAAIALLAFTRAAVPDETTYYVGHHPKYVNITFESEADIENIVGTTNKAAGEIKADLAKGAGSVSITVPVASLKTGIDMRDEHLRSEMWLNAAKFPAITFASKKVEKGEGNTVKVTGDFSMHGVTKEITVTVEWKELPDEVVKKAKFPEGKWLKFTTKFEVKLSDFGVKIPEFVVGKVSDAWTVKMAMFSGTAKPEAEKK